MDIDKDRIKVADISDDDELSSEIPSGTVPLVSVENGGTFRESIGSDSSRVYRNQLIPPLPLADDFVPYDLRHTYCTDLARAGVDIRTAQKLMGHANISVTADI